MRGPTVSLLVVMAACAPEDILLATLTGDAGDASSDGSLADAGGDAAPGQPAVCRNSFDCEPGEMCEKSSCEASRGLCTRRPVVCGTDPNPVCGCDGLTYFNDCLRRSKGMVAALRDECAWSAVLCGGPGDDACPDQARCGKLGNDSCSEWGQCWVLPNRCEDSSRGDFEACFGASTACVSACNAIASEQPHVRTPRCDPH